MGGKLTCRILEQGRHVWENWSEGKERLILSAQSEQDEVRYFLEANRDFRFSGKRC